MGLDALLTVDGDPRGVAVGGKAVGLRVLLDRGHRVPPFTVLPVDAVPQDGTVEQPLEAAAAEVSADGLRYQRRAQDLWRRQLLRLREGLGDHQPRHILTGAVPVDEHDRRYHSGWYASRRAAHSRAA